MITIERILVKYVSVKEIPPYMITYLYQAQAGSGQFEKSVTKMKRKKSKSPF